MTAEERAAAEAKRVQELKARADILHRRRAVGYGLAVVAVLLVLVLGGFSLYELDKAIDLNALREVHFDIARLVVHGAVTIALVFFLYQLLRMSERLLIPDWWIKSAGDIRAVLGIRQPAQIAMKEIKALAGLMKTIRGKESKKDEEDEEESE